MSVAVSFLCHMFFVCFQVAFQQSRHSSSCRHSNQDHSVVLFVFVSPDLTVCSTENEPRFTVRCLCLSMPKSESCKVSQLRRWWQAQLESELDAKCPYFEAELPSLTKPGKMGRCALLRQCFCSMFLFCTCD